MRVFLFESNRVWGTKIRDRIENSGYTIEWSEDDRLSSLTLLGDEQPVDLVILDLGLPERSGLKILQSMREKNLSVPVIMLSERDLLSDRLECLDSGADDCLTKPFHFDELLARMRALERRTKPRTKERISSGGLVLDPTSHTIQFQGETLFIPEKEFLLLQKLLENLGRAISREHLSDWLNRAWGVDIKSNVLEVYIHNLRKRFGKNLIRTMHSMGYMIESEV